MITKSIYREEFGRELARLRIQSGLSGRELAKLLKISQSKYSKLENGKLIPSESFLNEFARALKLPAAKSKELFKLSSILLSKIEHLNFGPHADYTRVQKMVTAIDYKSLCMFQPNLIPGPLQTEQYVRSLFSSIDYNTPNNTRTSSVENAIKERLLQIRKIDDTSRTFRFIITENALRNRISNAKCMRQQYIHLQNMLSRDNLKIKVIPWSVNYIQHKLMLPLNGFDLFDNNRLGIEITMGWINITDTSAVNDYQEYFNQLWAIAIGDAAAADLINRISNEINSANI